MHDEISHGLPGRDHYQFIPRRQGFDGVKALYYETVFQDRAHAEVFTYTDRLSYRAGDTVRFFTSTTAGRFEIEIVRDGLRPVLVARLEGLAGESVGLREGFYERGCDWPQSAAWQVPADAPPGFYIVTSRAVVGEQVREQEHGFFVSPAKGRRAAILMVASTCTWTAYNDWGGANHYLGHGLPKELPFAPRLSLHRPWARGLIWTPPGAPRKAERLRTPLGAIPRYAADEFAFARGFSKFYASAGWASYNRPFLLWAEAAGFDIDVVAQPEIADDPDLLADYRCVVFVGHDEYWTWEMREAVERYVAQGGNVARFAGNFSWQIRLEDQGATQVCYKEQAFTRDPLAGTADRRRTTGAWDDPRIDWPGEATFGLSTIYGMYAGVGGMMSRGGGFTVYRPAHWAFDGLYLGYGDVVGANPPAFGYEVDGLEYEMVEGLPRPTSRMRTPDGLEILAMGVAANIEPEHGRKGETLYFGDQSGEFAMLRYGSTTPERRDAAARGCGMIVSFERGRGSVFHAGSCEWVAGLEQKDEVVERITRNVLERFTG